MENNKSPGAFQACNQLLMKPTYVEMGAVVITQKNDSFRFIHSL